MSDNAPSVSSQPVPFSDLDLRDTNRTEDGRAVFELIEDFHWWVACTEGEITQSITVPKGTLTDFASIPALAWPIVGPPSGEYRKAAVVHDMLYRRQVVSRFFADAIMREIMLELKVPTWKRLAIFYALRWWGWRAYRKNQEPL